MGGGRGKKRNYKRFAEDNLPENNLMGVGATLAHLQSSVASSDTKHDKSDPDSEGWQVVDRTGKRQKQKNYPSLNYSNSYRMQTSVRLGDLQGLVLYCLADGTSPQWVAVRHHMMIKKVVVLFVPGLERGMFDGSIALEEEQDASSGAAVQGQALPGRELANGTENQSYDFSSHTRSSILPDDYLPTELHPEKLPEALKPLAETFSHLWPVKSPGDDRMGKVHSPLQAMLQSPLPKSQEERRAEKDTRGPRPTSEGKNWENKRTPITDFRSSSEILQENEYVLHPANLETEQARVNYNDWRVKTRQDKEHGWVDTCVESLTEGTIPAGEAGKGSILGGHTVLAMDCEMCRVEGGELALTRISLVDWNGTVIMDELVKPDKAIIDYLTPYSGMTAEKLDPVNTTLRDIQERLLTLLTPHTNLVGHSLNADLTAIKLTHPFIVDTSVLYPHPRGPPMKSSLKWLTQRYLSREIQKGHGAVGHDSVEDARACLDLVRLKCEKGPTWGTSEASNESIFKRLKRSPVINITSPSQIAQGKEGAIIDHGSPERNFGAMASYCIGCSSDAEIVNATKRAVLGDEDGTYIPGDGVPFTWARLRELELLRGWRNDESPAPPTTTSNNTTASPPSPLPPPRTTPTPTSLASGVAQTVSHIRQIRTFLPPSTLLIVYTGTGDPREMARLQDMKRTFSREYRTKKWDELSVKWTDDEEQALRAAARKAREGMGLVCIT